jgi:hypothetical protein
MDVTVRALLEAMPASTQEEGSKVCVRPARKC